MVIQLDPRGKAIRPSALGNIYGLEFRPMVSGFLESGSRSAFERHQGKVYLKTFPSTYGLVAVGERSVVSAQIQNAGLVSILKQSTRTFDTADGGFPGKVGLIQLISRKLENRAGAEVLK